MSRFSITLLLTATIVPPAGVPGLAQVDSVQRMEQYAQALDYYLTLPRHLVGRIVFAENSGADLAPLRQRAAKSGGRVTLVQWPGLDHRPSHGRGYGEFKLLDHVLFDSGAFPADANPVIWKATGRYKVLNLPTLILSAPPRYELYCDLKDRPMPWVDLRTFSFTRSGYDRLLRGAYHTLREDVNHCSPERVLRKRIGAQLDRSPRDAATPITPRFNVEPRIDGVRGLDQRRYLDARGKVKFYIRQSSRRLMPELWI